MNETTKLSHTMGECLSYITRHGGKIVRHRGGLWAKPGISPTYLDIWYSKSTVMGLHKRGLVSVEYSPGVAGKPYPTAATLKVNQ